MLTSSAKSKGRTLQKAIRDRLRKIGAKYGLESGDTESRGMGQNGTDVILSPHANEVFGRLAIECKNQETLNVTKIFLDHAAKYPKYIPMLFHKRNKTPILVTMTLDDFMLYFEEATDTLLYASVGDRQKNAA